MHTASLSTPGFLVPSIRRCLRQRFASWSARSRRCVYVSSNLEGVVSQRVAEAHEWRFSYWDFTKEADPLRAAESWMRADAAQPMSVEQWPLFGFALFKLCANEFLWFFRSHHLIMDGYSGQVVTQRLAEIYSSLSQGRIGGVQQLGSLRDVIDEDVAYRRSPSFESDRKFWLDALNECTESPPFIGACGADVRPSIASSPRHKPPNPH